jgi:hypothetical protein
LSAQDEKVTKRINVATGLASRSPRFLGKLFIILSISPNGVSNAADDFAKAITRQTLSPRSNNCREQPVIMDLAVIIEISPHAFGWFTFT